MAAIVLAIAVLIALVAIRPWTWGGDAREYPHRDGRIYVSYGHNSFEHDLLPRYELALPCSVDDLRWGDNEDLVGTGGGLFVKFSASPDCLATFISANHLESTVSSSFPEVPQRYGWSIDAGSTFYTNQTDLNTSTVAVVNGPKNPTVYVAIEHK